MLGPAIVADIRRLLGEGRLSQRAIARHLRVSRGVVYAIAQGRRAERSPEKASAVLREGLWERCPGCGGRVQMPCLLCRMRALRQRGHAWPCGWR